MIKRIDLEETSKNDYVMPKEAHKKLATILTADLGTQEHVKIKFKEKY